MVAVTKATQQMAYTLLGDKLITVTVPGLLSSIFLGFYSEAG